ncbi:hypothetical protein ABT354_29040 [Streptomyces sp. NPDC000594]|uniref:hypothetical protein n=1 Tax=Streptomyces sp. NPDC000594 TaxID=3154261 RepID=UPI00331A69B9
MPSGTGDRATTGISTETPADGPAGIPGAAAPGPRTAGGVLRRRVPRRQVLGGGLGAAAALGLAGCGLPGGDSPDRPGPTGGATPRSGGENPAGGRVRLIGDGSTSDSGPQPGRPPRPTRLQPGQTPPQFVVFSWDGAGEIGNGLFPRFLDLARRYDASMTFFLSGIYLLPEDKKSLYRPPNNRTGASDIGYLADRNIERTLSCLRRAWLEGHEIGTHFNGHFCAGSGSVDRWTSADWESEIEQAMSFVTSWRTHTGRHDLPPLPFDYRTELIGGRTPCLLGQDRLLPAARRLGWRYDASSPGGLQVWPGKREGLWDLPLQQLPFPGRGFEVLSMDYNFMVNQSGNATKSPPARHAAWRKQATGAYLQGFRRAYEGNRAPLFIGNHFEEWNGGIYMDAVENALRGMAGEKDVRLVSFRQLCDWLDAQDPAVLAKLRTLGVGQGPADGWEAFLDTP